MALTDKKSAIAYCLTYENVYEDYPFRDTNWCVIRHVANQKVFAWIFDKDGNTWINFKNEPLMGEMWRRTYAAVLPGYHLNHVHWSSVILDGTVKAEDLKMMLDVSYELTKKRGKKNVPKASV